MILKRKIKLIKDGIIGNIRVLFGQEKEEDCYEPKRVNNFGNKNYIKNESNGDRHKNLSLDGYLNKIETYFRNIITNIWNSDTWKTQLKIALNFVSLKDNEEKSVMHLNSDNIKFTSYRPPSNKSRKDVVRTSLCTS